MGGGTDKLFNLLVFLALRSLRRKLALGFLGLHFHDVYERPDIVGGGHGSAKGEIRKREGGGSTIELAKKEAVGGLDGWVDRNLVVSSEMKVKLNRICTQMSTAE